MEITYSRKFIGHIEQKRVMKGVNSYMMYLVVVFCVFWRDLLHWVCDYMLYNSVLFVCAFYCAEKQIDVYSLASP